MKDVWTEARHGIASLQIFAFHNAGPQLACSGLQVLTKF